MCKVKWIVAGAISTVAAACVCFFLAFSPWNYFRLPHCPQPGPVTAPCSDMGFWMSLRDKAILFMLGHQPIVANIAIKARTSNCAAVAYDFTDGGLVTNVYFDRTNLPKEHVCFVVTNRQ